MHVGSMDLYNRKTDVRHDLWISSETSPSEIQYC